MLELNTAAKVYAPARWTPWDGITPESSHRYPVETSTHPLFIDEGGNIAYKDSSGKLQPWCSRCRLRYHLQRLFQIGVIS